LETTITAAMPSIAAMKKAVLVMKWALNGEV
jgi:hypothetical protein